MRIMLYASRALPVCSGLVEGEHALPFAYSGDPLCEVDISLGAFYDPRMLEKIPRVRSFLSVSDEADIWGKRRAQLR